MDRTLLTLTIQIHLSDEGDAPSMSSDRIRRLALQMKEKARLEDQEQQLQLLRKNVLAAKGSHFWKEFIIALTSASDDFKAELGHPPAWNDFMISSLNHEEATITKHANPYLNATLALDVAGGCIRGKYKRAPQRPGGKSLPEQQVMVDLNVDRDNQIYGTLNGDTCQSTEELAAAIIVLLLTD